LGSRRLPAGPNTFDILEHAVSLSYCVGAVTLEEMEQALRQRLQALPRAARAELLRVLMLPDFDRADRIGAYWGNPCDPYLRRSS
jgi:hypothetical protein